ncbi:hypothetical protein PHSY_006185 [Pseudozyma hubeiensis SY62]|uniref:Uncharacterized protein n=1 Tax=Pseudozyma hubeiensis (strain SY62) TaxID=1305764 RepID=R9PB37_PSEHS|nr:hypothetical protein PHSY_006185 [Pseudozyma hubeiensis SY62]GAC98591.1 hypothetical protein PHSY_006185 [Pseudozyma hubeiensis SY62]
MMMSPPLQLEPFAGIGTCASRSVVSGFSKSAPTKPSSRVCAADLAVKQLLQQKSTPLSASSVASASRPLQSVDVNIPRSGIQPTTNTSSTTVTPTSSPKVGSRRISTKKVRSSSSSSSSALHSIARTNKLGSTIDATASVTLKGERISIKVPQKLPTPLLKPNSSPYEDLVAHLSRHHFFQEAQQLEQQRLTPDFYLTQYLETAHLGKSSLYHQTETFLNANKQLLLSKVVPGQALPETIPVDITEWVNMAQRTPTHLLAVHSDREAATLYCVHGLVLALQCVSIPVLPGVKESQEGGRVVEHMPTVALKVPSVQHFNTIVRWLYSQSTTSLLHELLPLQHIVTYLTCKQLSSKPPSSTTTIPTLSSADILSAMSTMSTRHFLERLQHIQAVWKNGVALGILSWSFWSTLDHAWNLTIRAMIACPSTRRRTAVSLKHVTDDERVARDNELTEKFQSTKIE